MPGKLGAEITSGAFVELADLLAENMSVQEAKPRTYSHMDSGLYHLPVDLLQYLPFSQAGYYSV